MKWLLMAFVGAAPAPVGHFTTEAACIQAILDVAVPQFDAQGKVVDFASLEAKNITMFCVPVERLMSEKAAAETQ